MNLKNAAIVAAAAGTAFATMSMLDPFTAEQRHQTPTQIQQQQREREVSDLSDADERQRNRYRDEGNALLDAESRDRLRPGERRPPAPPRFRFVPK